MGDHTCHRNEKTNRPKLKLGGVSDIFAVISKIERFKRGKTEEQEALREHSRKLAEERQARRNWAEERRAVRKRQTELDVQHAERRRQKWLELSAKAIEIGLIPDPRWSELEFLTELYDRRRAFDREELKRYEDRYRAEEKQRIAEQRLLWQRREREEAARFRAQVWEQSVARNCEVRGPIDLEELGDKWEHIPHVARHGIARRKTDPWGRIGWEHWSKPQAFYQARGRHRMKAAVAMAEQLDQWLGRRSSHGRGMRPQ